MIAAARVPDGRDVIDVDPKAQAAGHAAALQKTASAEAFFRERAGTGPPTRRYAQVFLPERGLGQEAAGLALMTEPYLARLDKKKLYGTLPIVVIIDDGNGYRSIYAHFSKVVVKKGQTVKAGQMLGYEGMTGRASGCHLHYGLFSPLETATFAIEPDVVKRMKVPPAQVARIDPLLVIPVHGAPKPSQAPTPKPSPSPTP